MYLIYIDDSTEKPRYIFSAMAVPVARWNEAFGVLKVRRSHLKSVHGISPRHELHANSFVAGRGSLGAPGVVSKHVRSQIFQTSFQVMEHLSALDVRLFNVCHNGRQDWAFERLLNRINTFMCSDPR